MGRLHYSTHDAPDWTQSGGWRNLPDPGLASCSFAILAGPKPTEEIARAYAPPPLWRPAVAGTMFLFPPVTFADVAKGHHVFWSFRAFLITSEDGPLNVSERWPSGFVTNGGNVIVRGAQSLAPGLYLG